MGILILTENHKRQMAHIEANERGMERDGPPDKVEQQDVAHRCGAFLHPDDVGRVFFAPANHPPICPSCRDMHRRLHNAGVLGKKLGDLVPTSHVTRGTPPVTFVSRHGKPLARG